MIARNRSRGFGVVARRPAQGLDKAGQGGERGAQLVAGIGDEIGAHLLGALQFGDVVQGQHRDRTLGRRPRRCGQSGRAAGARPARVRVNSTTRAASPRNTASAAASTAGLRNAAARSRGGEQRADKSAGGGVGAHDPPPLVEQDQRIGDRGDDRFGRGEARLRALRRARARPAPAAAIASRISSAMRLGPDAGRRRGAGSMASAGGELVDRIAHRGRRRRTKRPMTSAVSSQDRGAADQRRLAGRGSRPRPAPTSTHEPGRRRRHRERQDMPQMCRPGARSSGRRSAGRPRRISGSRRAPRARRG